jgi:hypothetical protein
MDDSGRYDAGMSPSAMSAIIQTAHRAVFFKTKY